MSTLAMTWVNTKAYTGYKKMIEGKVYYLGQDRDAAEIKLLQTLLLVRTGQTCEVCKPEGGTTTHTLIDAYVEHSKTLPASPAWRQAIRQRITRVRTFLPDCALDHRQRAAVGSLYGRSSDGQRRLLVAPLGEEDGHPEPQPVTTKPKAYVRPTAPRSSGGCGCGKPKK